jgi:hypothetical protein
VVFLSLNSTPQDGKMKITDFSQLVLLLETAANDNTT